MAAGDAMTCPRRPIERAVSDARGRGLNCDELHALNNILDALEVPLERPEPKEWR